MLNLPWIVWLWSVPYAENYGGRLLDPAESLRYGWVFASRLFTDLFIDTNPIPVKAALAMMGRIEELYRLPLCETSEKNKTAIKECLQELDLL